MEGSVPALAVSKGTRRATPESLHTVQSFGQFPDCHGGGRAHRGGTDLFYGLAVLESLPRELEYKVACGMGRADALVAATAHRAAAFGVEGRMGAVARGKLADLLVVGGDPTANIMALRSVALVVQDGQILAGARGARQPP
jgi:hypothetical protein